MRVLRRPGWQVFLEGGDSTLPEYKVFIWSALANKSATAWRISLVRSSASSPHLLTQRVPCGAAKRVFDAGFLNTLQDVDIWDRCRLGLESAFTSESLDADGKCVYCGGLAGGMGHILSNCLVFAHERSVFLASVDANWGRALVKAPAGDWLVEVFRPQMDMNRLLAAVNYCADMLRKVIVLKRD